MQDTDDRMALQEELARLQAEVERYRRLARDAEPLRQELVESEARYRNLVELAVDAIFMGDPEGNIIGANRSAVTLTGYPLAELLGRNLAMLFSEEERARVPLRYDLLKAGKIVQNERLLTRRDGSTMAIGMNSRMMPDGTYHTFMRDFSEYRATQEKMLSLIRDLEAFTGTVSHDLRSPLSSILLAAELLAAKSELARDRQGRELLEVIHSAATGMLALVENLLALARAEQVERPAQPVDSNRVLARVLANLAQQRQSCGSEILARPLPALKIPEVFLAQIFHNLIGNALNYAGGGNRPIEVGGEEEAGVVRFFVRDHGPGIAAAERARIFDAYYRGSGSRAAGGSGLGLAIVAKLASAFGGRAWVEETPGGGCTFRVELEKDDRRAED